MKKYDYVLMANGAGWIRYGGLFESDVNPQDLLDELWDDDSYCWCAESCENFEYSVVRQGDADYDDASYRVFRLPEDGGYMPADFHNMEELKKAFEVEELAFRLNRRLLSDEELFGKEAEGALPMITFVVHQPTEMVP